MTTHTVALGEVATIVMGQAPRGNTCNKANNGTPFVKAGEFTESRPIIREWTTNPLRLARKSDVLVCVVGATAGKVNQGTDCAIGRSVAAIRPVQKYLDSDFLYRFLKTQIMTLRTQSQGLAQSVITRDMLSAIEVPLPPLEEQRRIAAILDKADALRQKRKQAIALLDSLTQSIFLEMFGDPSKNPNGFDKGNIQDVLVDASYGSSAKAGEVGAFPILRMGNITYDGRLDLKDLKYIDLPTDEVEKYTVKMGDILFNRTNSADLVGKTAVFNQHQPFAFAGYLVRARVNSRAVPEYVAGYLNSRHGKAVLRNKAKSIVGMANINAKEMQSIPILIPPIKLQRDFADRLAAIGKKRDTMSASIQKAEGLFASLQHRAFSGHL